MMKCPRCGYEAVDQYTEAWKLLSPLGRAVFERLWKAHGKPVLNADLIFAMYNGAHEPENAHNILGQTIHQIRKRFTVHNVKYSILNHFGSYSLEAP